MHSCWLFSAVTLGCNVAGTEYETSGHQFLAVCTHGSFIVLRHWVCFWLTRPGYFDLKWLVIWDQTDLEFRYRKWTSVVTLMAHPVTWHQPTQSLPSLINIQSHSKMLQSNNFIKSLVWLSRGINLGPFRPKYNSRYIDVLAKFQSLFLPRWRTYFNLTYL